MKETWRYYLRLGPIRIPLGSTTHDKIEIKRLDFKPTISKCSHHINRRGLKCLAGKIR